MLISKLGFQADNSLYVKWRKWEVYVAYRNKSLRFFVIKSIKLIFHFIVLIRIFTNKACAFIFCRHRSFTLFLQNRDVGNESNVIHWTYNDYLWTALMAPRAGCICYHLWFSNHVGSGVKVDKSQATISFSLFSFAFSCYSPFYILFLTSILDVLWKCLCQIIALFI